MKLVAGLGNPGTQYEDTRHNAGFMLLDRLIGELEPSNASKPPFRGELYKTGSLLLLKPNTFMNLSGESVRAVADYYNIATEDIIVVHDDLDLGFGALKYKRGGGHGGHNGLRSLDACIGSSYLRVRMGIGKPALKSDVSRYVLDNFSKQERSHLDALLQKAMEATLLLIKGEALPHVASCYSQKSIAL